MALTDKVVRLREIDGVIYASSRDVAEDYGKRHADVLRSIEDVRETLSANLRSAWFRDDRYYDSTQRSLPCIDMTRDGWTLLVMSFTGPEAMAWKVAYILKFNEMEGKLGSGAKTEALFDRTKRDNVVPFEGPPKPQAEFNLAPTPTVDANERHLRAITGMGHSVSFDEQLSVAEHRELIRNSVETWTDHHDGVAYPIRRINNLRGQTMFLYIGTGYSVDLTVPNADGQSRVMVRVAKTLPYSAFSVVERNYRKLGNGPYVPIAIATLRHWLAP